MRAVIIDDIPDARAALRADLEAYCPEVEVIGEAEGVVSGAKLVRQVNPEIVFLDIQMPDGSGFDLLDVVGQVDFRIIFTTASDAFAIRAFRYSAVDYLLKPIDPEDLTEAVGKISEQQNDPSESLDLLRNELDRKESGKRIALHTQDKIHVAVIADIVRLESSGNYTRFFFADGSKLLVTRTLKEFDKMLQEHRFLRVHQSHLINPNHLREFVKIDGGYLVMNDGSEVPVSTRKRNEVLQELERL